MEFLVKLSSVFFKVGAIADREALVEMKGAALFERDFSVTAHVDKEQKAASIKSFFLVLVFSLFLLFFLGLMVARRSNRRQLSNGNADADQQPDAERQMTTVGQLIVSQNNHPIEIEIEEDNNPPPRSPHCTLEAKCNFGTRLAFVNFVLEIPSAVLDQITPDNKPTYVLMMMLFSMASMLLCLGELVYKGKVERITWKWRWSRGRIPWFYHPPPSDTPFGTFTEIIGLTCAMAQCIVTIINYCFCVQNHTSPIKIQVWPSIFGFGLLCSKLMGNPDEEDRGSRASDRDVGDIALLNHPVLEPYTPPESHQ